jgi:nucleotide-binding universal stress UspA family protein
MFRKILMPIDGSRTAARGLDVAIKLAKGQKAALVILHVLDVRLVSGSEVVSVYLDEIIKSLRVLGEKILARAVARARASGLTPGSVLVEEFGRPVAHVIVAQARKLRADVIVLGTHGRRGVTRLLMGSDAEGVVRRSPVPVLLVRSRERQGSPGKR